MTRRLAHFSDPRLDAQVEELIKHGNATRDAADKHAARRDNPHKVRYDQVGAAPAVHTHTAQDVGAIPFSEKGQPNGVATLDSGGKVPDAQIPDGITRDTELAAHTSRTDNPHQVTAAQVGAVSKAGDTMTGALNLPVNGLDVGGGQLKANGFGLILGAHDQTSRGNSGASRALEKVSGVSGPKLVVNYARDFPGGVDVYTSRIGMQIITPYGYVNIGPRNTGWCHYVTDRPKHWFDRDVGVAGEIWAGRYYNQKVWHAGNALRAGFYAYLSASQSLPRGATTKIAFNAELFDHANAFDTTNNRFVAPQRGVYLFEVNVNTTYYGCYVPKWTLYLYKNGVEAVMLNRLYAESMYAGYCLSGSAMLLLNAGDYVEVYVNWQENQSNNTAEGGSTRSSFAGVMLYSV